LLRGALLLVVAADFFHPFVVLLLVVEVLGGEVHPRLAAVEAFLAHGELVGAHDVPDPVAILLCHFPAHRANALFLIAKFRDLLASQGRLVSRVG
jgi:hypothetical protein